jgi:hypothetical protein
MFTYKCRSEVVQDICNVILSFTENRLDHQYMSGHQIINKPFTDLNGNIVKDDQGHEVYFPDCTWVFNSNMDIDEVLHQIEKCPEMDLHYIYESINYIEIYTGERFRD